MPELEIFKSWAPQAYGIWILVFMFGIYLLREYRETRKLSSSDRLARREGYARQVQDLTTENRALGRDMRDLREEYDDYRRLCREETDQLRGTIRLLEDKVEGLNRRIDAQGSSAVRLIRDAQRPRED